MLQTIRDFFDRQMLRADADEAEAGGARLRLASAALLIETSRADFQVREVERSAVAETVRRHFGLSTEQTRELIDLAEQEATDATSLFAFTHLINSHYDDLQKSRLMELMWEVAYADGHLDKYEEHLLRKVADLLHMRHRDFIEAKHRVQQALDVASAPASGATP